MTSRERFLDLMKREILKLDLAELDFGIYRVLNYRRSEIERFFDDELPEALDAAMTHETDRRRAELSTRVNELRSELERTAAANDLPAAFEGEEIRAELAALPKAVAYTEATVALANLADDPVFGESEEDRLYNALYTFFGRYYRDGDFQPQQRRARDSRYSVPYNGEDVHFHWRSKGSHYVKTSEDLRSYSFRTGEWRVRFELVQAEADDPTSEKRFFVPLADRAGVVDGEASTFVFPLELRPLSAEEQGRYGKGSDEVEGDSIQERLIADLGASESLPGGLDPNAILHHLRRYTRKSRSDYFVHPQLGAFLRDELDYYLKNEVLDIEGLTSLETAADRLGKLHALRSVALRIIDLLHEIEEFQARLFEKRKFVLASDYCVTVDRLPSGLHEAVLQSAEQLTEWREMYELDIKNAADLERNPYLVVDTANYPGSFKDELLASFDDIDEALSGIAFQSDGWHALRLASTFRDSVRCIYVDPPFNTETDQFAYLDRYRSSTWLTLLSERLQLALPLLTEDGTTYVHLDHNSNYLIRPVLDEIFGPDRFLNEVIWRIGWVSGYKTAADRYVRNHETLYVHTKSARYYFDKDAARIPYRSFAEKTVSEELKAIANKWDFSMKTKGPLKVVLKDRDGGVWKLGLETKDGRYNVEDTWNCNEYEELHSNKIKRNAAEYTPNGSHITQKPEQLLARIIGVSSQEGDVVADFFAGTGTTAAVAMKMKRKFLAVEPGYYFDSDLLWRLKQVLFGRQVGVSAVVGHSGGGAFQYVRLETYEDSLNSLSLDAAKEDPADRSIRYAIPSSVEASPCLLVTEDLEAPFDYNLEIHTDDGVQARSVDLVTTFNLMKGIRPRRYRRFDIDSRSYVVVEGVERGDHVLVVWRNVDGLDPESERSELSSTLPEVLGVEIGDYTRVYHNGDSVLPNGVSLDGEFKRLMFEPETALT
jgi:adenine-specific DNA-methyltransferase